MPKPTQDEIVAAMDAQVLAAQENPSLIIDGDPNDGGHVTIEGHGWTEEQLAERAETNGEAAAPAPVAMETGVATSAKKK